MRANQAAYIGDDLHTFPVTLVGLYDKTHSDDKGVLATSPSLISCDFLDLDTRKKSYASFPIVTKES